MFADGRPVQPAASCIPLTVAGGVDLAYPDTEPTGMYTRLAECGYEVKAVTGIVVRDDGRILAIKRSDDGRWVPPGGVLELDETPQDGVAREVYEETGIKVRPTRLTGDYENMKLGVVSLAFACEVIGGGGDAAGATCLGMLWCWVTAVPRVRS